jgi:hypothetical protein
VFKVKVQPNTATGGIGGIGRLGLGPWELAEVEACSAMQRLGVGESRDGLMWVNGEQKGR